LENHTAVLASISKEKVIVDDGVAKRASEFEKMGLKGIDACIWPAQKNLQTFCSQQMMIS